MSEIKMGIPSVERVRENAASGVGARVRSLRVAAGLSQSALAADRFSKEYISQIELEKTRPTTDTIAYLAERLGVDPLFLSEGITADERSRVEAVLARGEALAAHHEYDEALATYDEIVAAVRSSGSVELEVRLLLGREAAVGELGHPRASIELLNRARAHVEGPRFSDVDRAEVIYRLGVARYRLSSIQTAVALFDEALSLAERSGLPCDRLRSTILEWRSRCRRRQRDYDAAREDAEHALELARAANDRRAMALAYFQASLVSERMGHMVKARSYALEAKALFQELDDERAVGRTMLNLGGLHLLLGNPHQALEHLNASFALAVEAESSQDAAQALGSLGTVHLHLGDYSSAADHARRALELLAGREDYLDEIGQSQLVLGRSLLEQGLLDQAEVCFTAADATFEQYASASHRAGAWVALGDLAERRGDARKAARLYRDAAMALQDVRF